MPRSLFRPLWMIAQVAAVCGGLLGAVSAEPVAFYSGNVLHEMCLKSPNEATLYVLGVMEGIGTADIMGFKSNVCIPEGVKGSQLRDVACRYLNANPDIRHNQAGGLVMIANQTAFLCRQGQP